MHQSQFIQRSSLFTLQTTRVCIGEPKEGYRIFVGGKRQRAQQAMDHTEISQLGLVLADLTAKVVKATSELEDQYVNAQDAF